MPLLVFGAMAWPFAALGQDAHMTWRVGVLETVAPALNVANFDALRAGLRDLGYIEGRNLVIEYRSADGHVDRAVGWRRKGWSRSAKDISKRPPRPIDSRC